MAQTTNRNGNENYSGRINKYCRDFAESNGHYNYTTYEKANEITGELEEKQMLDPINPFTWNDPNMYVFVLIDNASNLSTEKGMDIWGTINKMSKYAITLKSQLNMIVVLIQHQAQDKEGNESFKLGRIKPSSDGLADCKVTSRDKISISSVDLHISNILHIRQELLYKIVS